MKTEDQIEKIKAVLLYVLQSFKSGVDYIKLYKILYFSQRESLATYGRVIIDDSFRARDKGPVPSVINGAIKAVEFNNFDTLTGFYGIENSIRIQNKKVYAKEKPDMDYISGKEKQILDKCIETCKGRRSSELSEISHDSAWIAANARRKEDPEMDRITLVEIAKAGGASEDTIEYIKDKQIINNAL